MSTSIIATLKDWAQGIGIPGYAFDKNMKELMEDLGRKNKPDYWKEKTEKEMDKLLLLWKCSTISNNPEQFNDSLKELVHIYDDDCSCGFYLCDNVSIIETVNDIPTTLKVTHWICDCCVYYLNVKTGELSYHNGFICT